MRRFFRIGWRILRTTFLVLMSLYLGLVWLISTDWMQKRLVPYVESILSSALHTRVHIDRFSIHLPAHAVVEGLVIEDQSGQPMISAPSADLSLINISLWRFLYNPSSQNPISVGDATLFRPSVHFYRSRGSGRTNFQFLTELGDTSQPKKPGSLRLNFRDIGVLDGQFSYVDSTRSDSLLASRNSFNPARMEWDQLNGNLSFALNERGMVSVFARPLSGRESWSGLRVDRFQGHFAYGRAPGRPRGSFLQIREGALEVGATTLNVDAFAMLGLDTVGGAPPWLAHAHLRPGGTLDFGTLNCLLPRPLPFSGIATIQGPLEIRGDTLRADSLSIRYGGKTDFRAVVRIDHLFSPEKLHLDLDFLSSFLNYEDLQALLPESVIPLAGTMRIQGRITGGLYSLESKNLVVEYLGGTKLALRANLDDFQKPEEMILDLKFRHSSATFADIRQLLPRTDIPSWLNSFGAMKVEGNFMGGIRDFVVHADFETRAGNIRSNLHLVLPPKSSSGLIEYSGDLTTEHFNLDILGISQNHISNRLNFAGSVRGKGTQLRDVSMVLEGRFQNSELLGYDLALVKTDSLRIYNQKVDGTVELMDSEGNASLALDLDLNDSLRSYNLTGDVKGVDLDHYLRPLGVETGGTFLTSVVNMKLTGNTADSLLGRAKFFLVSLEKPAENTAIEIHDLVVRARENTPKKKLIEMRSSILDAEIRGDFSWARGFKMAERLEKEISLYIQAEDSLVQNYYSQKVLDSLPAKLNVGLTTRPEFNSFVSFWKIPLRVADSTQLGLTVTSNQMDHVDIGFHSDSIAYGPVRFLEVTSIFRADKDAFHNSLIAFGNVKSEVFSPSPSVSFQKFLLEPNILDNTMEYWLGFKQEAFGNLYRFNAVTTFEPIGIVTRIRPKVSFVQVPSGTWTVEKENHVLFREGKLKLEGLELSKGSQRISLTGILSKEEKEKAILKMNQVEIPEILAVAGLSIPIGGRIDTLEAKVGGVFSEPKLTVMASVDHFKYKTLDSIHIGLVGYYQNISAKGKIPPSNMAAMRSVWSYKGTDALIVKGTYDVGQDRLALRSDSSRFPLVWVQPFAEGLASNIHGFASVNDLKINGSIRSPKLFGVATLEQAGATLDLLNAPFTLSPVESLEFDNEAIRIPGMTLFDTAGHTARLMGTVFHSEKEGIRLDLRLDKFREFTVMNTRSKDSELFYGRVVLNGDSCLITGFADKININAWVTTAKGSWLDIPLTDYTSADRLDFVQFAGAGDTLSISPPTTDLSGFLLGLTVHATPDARVRMIFDEQVGDIMEAYGEGDLTLQISDKGDFTMYGNYEVERGDYLFTAQNVVNKKFLVDRGGVITWDGSPYNARLNLDATYRVNPDISTLLGDQAGSGRVPVDIVMHMTGSLISPLINLELRLSQLNQDDVLGLASYFRNIQYDEQELNRQVVTLLMFRRFAPKADVSGGTGSAGVTSSISELISNQLNYWLSQAVSQNVGISFNTNQFQDVEMAIRYNLFGDRVTIERNGTLVGNRSNTVSIGDLSVHIKLLPVPANPQDSTGGRQTDPAKPNQGQLVLEIFNRENVNFNNTSTNTTGAGVFFKKDFDRIWELFGKKDEEWMRKHPQKVIIQP